jgi:hypothetical protein
MPVLIQVTLGSGPKQISTSGINVKQLIVQDNSPSTTTRLGDSTVVAGAYGTGRGILISGGSANWGALPIQAGLLSSFWLAGPAATVIDVMYEPA